MFKSRQNLKKSSRMKKITIVSAIALSFLCLQHLMAQETMTLNECMNHAVNNAIKVKMQELETDDASVARRDAILQAFTPAVEAGSSAQLSFGRTINPETNTYVTSATFGNSYSLNGGIYLFNGFSSVNNIKISRTALKMGVRKEELAKDEICLATMQAYYNVVYYQQLASILEEQVNTAQAALTLAARQEELGQKGHADVVEMEAELADREYRLVTARNQHADAIITLKDLMFWPMDQDLAIDTSMTDVDEISFLSYSDEVENVTDNAISNHPSIAIAKGNMEKARYELSTARWKFAPNLYLSSGWSTSYYTYPGQEGYVPLPFWNQLKNNQGEWIGLSLSIPIYNRLYNHSQIRRKKNAYARASLEYEQKKRDIEAEVARAIQDRDGSAASFRQAERRASVQEEAYALNMRKFEQGLISPIDFQKASDNWLEAKTARLDALLKFYIRRSVVDYYNGISYLAQ